MSDVMRSRDPGSLVTVRAPVDSGTVIEVGDLLWYDTDDAKPATDIAFNTSESQTKQDFADQFAGVAMAASDDGETEDIAVAIAGLFEMDQVSATAELFALVSAVGDGTGLTADQSVVVTATASEAIGYVAKREGSANTRVLIRLLTIEARQSLL